MNQVLQLVGSGVALGAIYALVALGFVVVHRASGVFNFAHGEMLTVGAFLMVSLSGAGAPFGVALIGAMTGTGLLGAGIERGVLRPLVGRPAFVTIIVTIFVGLLLRAGVLIVWGTETQGVPTPWEPTAVLELPGGARILWNSVAAIVAAAVVLVVLYLGGHATSLGVASRATASDQQTALGLGIPVGRIFGLTWFVAGATAALAGVCLGAFPRNVEPTLGLIALRAFPAVIVGGLDSVSGTVLAGLLLGVLEVLTQGYVNEHLGTFGHNFHAVFPYLAMIVLLAVRPEGLLGTRHVERL